MGLSDKIKNSILKTISKSLDDGEEHITYMGAETSPAEWMSWLPVFSTYHKLKKRWYILCLTSSGVRCLEHGSFNFTNIKDNVLYEQNEIKSFAYKKGLLFCDFSILTKREKIEFKEIEWDQLNVFLTKSKEQGFKIRKSS